MDPIPKHTHKILNQRVNQLKIPQHVDTTKKTHVKTPHHLSFFIFNSSILSLFPIGMSFTISRTKVHCFEFGLPAAAAAAAPMILNPHSASKLDQIMSRYRPIAPKPQIPITTTPGMDTSSSSPPETITQQQQTKPRSRKRGKYGISSAIRKRAKTSNTYFPESSSSPYGVASLAKNTQLGLSLQGFCHGYPQFPPPLFPGPLVSGDLEMGTANLVRLPFLPYSSSSSSSTVSELHCMNPCHQMKENSAAETPKEMDLLQNLHGPSLGLSTPQSGCGRNIIAPQAVRPVGSSIIVGCISQDPNSNTTTCVSKKPEEVEAEVESDALPVVVSDSNNRVRLANSAFKEMVGQPECLWLDSMATCNEQSKGGACKRISGGVLLDLSNSPVPVSSNGFSCRVSIEWGNKEHKSSINAPCDVIKLSCAAKDYLFTWRIHTREASDCNPQT